MFKTLLILILFCGFLFANSLSGSNNSSFLERDLKLAVITDSDMLNGVSFVSENQIPIRKDIKKVKQVLNANWIAVLPYGFCNKGEYEVQFNSKYQWEGETTVGIGKTIDSMKLEGFKVMLKPQVWIRDYFTGHVKPETKEDWETLQLSYAKFIFSFAKIAEEKSVDLFCIGTEWEAFVENNPEYWSILIDQIKTIYHGQLTYAANWDEYQKVPFWDKIDFVGIDGYFPLTEEPNISFSALKKRFNEISSEIEDNLTVNGKMRNVLFTEYGWRSSTQFLNAPWNSERQGEVNLEIQSKIYLAFYSTIWQKEWCKGGFIWKWFQDYESSGGINDNRFTPQNKPVAKIISRIYKD